jgi:hypothetical protein
LKRARTKGILGLDELATQKSQLDKDIEALRQGIAQLRAEAEPQILTTERIDTIETMAAQLRAGVDVATADSNVQRTIFQLLDVQVILSAEGEQRWADVSCTLGDNRCAIASNVNSGILHTICWQSSIL